MKKIIFYAASDKNVPPQRIGGAEAGAKRTYNILVEQGFDVTYIPKVNMLNGMGRFIKDFFKTKKELKHLFKENRGNAVFYITAFYKKQTFIEYLFIKKAKKNNIDVIYEPKNGSFVRRYQEGSKKYKKIVDKTIALSDAFFCQGQEYVDFIKTKSNKPCFYLPNYVKEIDDHIPSDNGVIDLVYFGRISESKNIDLIIDALNIIKKTHQVRLKIIGSTDTDYYQKLVSQINSLHLESDVSFLGRLSLEEIRKECKDSDFFVFPSTESEEGHSNSLTEAMSFGLIPVTSPNGFSRSIVNNDIYVVDELKAEEYALRILELTKELEKHKKFAKNRILEAFTADVVIPRQIEFLKSITK